MENDYISMPPGHELVPVHGMRDMSLWHINTFTFCIKKPVCHASLMEIDYISMSPGHELVAVHGMHDTSLGYSDKLTFCIKTLRMSWRLDGDWLYFHVLGTWISSCSWHPRYVPGTYRHMSPEHELVSVHGMCGMSLGHVDSFTFCIKTPSMSWRLKGNWSYFHVPGTWISSYSWHAWNFPGTYRHIHILNQNPRM